jgi:hypothetical protein
MAPSGLFSVSVLVGAYPKVYSLKLSLRRFAKSEKRYRM